MKNMNAGQQSQCKLKAESITFEASKGLEPSMAAHDDVHAQMVAAQYPSIEMTVAQWMFVNSLNRDPQVTPVQRSALACTLRHTT